MPVIILEPVKPVAAYLAATGHFMLSLTVLPASLQALAGISALVALKVVYPALFALFPPALFGIANRFLSRRYAFVAAAFVVVQSYFFQQLPAIARQEIGLLFFVALVAAVVDRRLPRGAQALLVAALGAGVVVAHYSTTYLAAGVFALAVVLQLVASRFRALRAVSLAMVVALLATGGGAAVWYGAVTHSADNVGAFAEDIRAHGLAILPNAHSGQSLVTSYLSGNAPAPIDPTTSSSRATCCPFLADETSSSLTGSPLRQHHDTKATRIVRPSDTHEDL